MPSCSTSTRAFSKKFTCGMTNKAFAGFSPTAQKVDEYTVDIKTDKPAPILATGFGVFTMASPKTPADEQARNPAGTGPYKFVEWVAGDRVVLERNDDYWGEKPEVSKVTFTFRPESAVRAAMSATGEADIAVAITEQDANNPETDHSYLNSETTWMRIDTRYAPMNDVRFRKALNYAVDREAMLGTVVSANAIPAAQLPVSGHQRPRSGPQALSLRSREGQGAAGRGRGRRRPGGHQDPLHRPLGAVRAGRGVHPGTDGDVSGRRPQRRARADGAWPAESVPGQAVSRGHRPEHHADHVGQQSRRCRVQRVQLSYQRHAIDDDASPSWTP